MKRRSWRAAVSACVVLLTLLPLDSRSQTGSATIPVYAPIEILFAEESADRSPSATASARVPAFGREYIAHLAQNRALVRKLPAATRAAIADVVIWEGTLDNIGNSWIRLVQHGSFLSGTFSDGIRTYEIEPFAYARDKLVDPNPADEGKIIVYEQPATPLPFGDLVVSNDKASSSTSEKPQDSGMTASLKPVLADGVEVEIAVAADSEFAAAYGVDAHAEAIARMNDADALFVQQIGIHLSMSELLIFDSDPDPFKAQTAQEILDEFASFTVATPAFAQADLAHLFTRRTLGENDDATTIGIANLGGICEPGQGVAVTAISSGLVTAHEVAHNFGVPHDGAANTVCANEDEGYVMDPLITGGSDHQNEFSDCSIEVLSQAVSSASCLGPIPSSDLQLTLTSAPTQVLGNKSFKTDFVLDSIGPYDTLVVEFSIDSPAVKIRDIRGPNSFPGLQCASDPMPALCTFHRLEANGSLPIAVFFNATEAGAVSIDFDAWSLNDADLGNNAATANIEIIPAVELKPLDVTVSPSLAIPDQLVTVSMALSNTGLVDATNIEGEITDLWNNFEFVSAQLPSGESCTLSPSEIFRICPIGDIPRGATRNMEFVLRALDTGATGSVQHSETFSMGLTATERDSGQGRVYAKLQVTSAAADVGLSITGPSSVIETRETTFAFTIENLGPDTADGMEFTFRNPGLDIKFPGLVGCTISDDGSEIACPVPQLHAGESREFTIGGFARNVGTHSAQAHVSVPAREPDLTNNDAVFEWRVTESPPPPPPSSSPSPSPSSGGGGGGATDPIWLLLLAAAGLLSRARSRSNGTASRRQSARRHRVESQFGPLPSLSGRLQSSLARAIR